MTFHANCLQKNILKCRLLKFLSGVLSIDGGDLDTAMHASLNPDFVMFLLGVGQYRQLFLNVPKQSPVSVIFCFCLSLFCNY